MSIPLEKLDHFKRFIQEETSPLGTSPYVLILVVEAYYEFVAEALVPNSSRSVTQFKLLEELLSLGLIDKQAYTIMNETRKLKNELTHRLDYRAGVAYLHDFYNNCTLPNKNVPKDKNDQEAIDAALSEALRKGYSVVEALLDEAAVKELSAPAV